MAPRRLKARKYPAHLTFDTTQAMADALNRHADERNIDRAALLREIISTWMFEKASLDGVVKIHDRYGEIRNIEIPGQMTIGDTLLHRHTGDQADAPGRMCFPGCEL